MSLVKRLLLGCIATCTSASASVVVVNDNFSSYAAGAVGPATGWSAKWDGTNTSQQNLATADGAGTLSVDLGTAERLYRIVNSTGFVVDSEHPSAVISADFALDYNGLNPAVAPVNQSMFGLMVSDTPNWWNGTNKGTYLSNRTTTATNTALGITVPNAPWIEGWMPLPTVGLTPGAAGTSDVFTIELALLDNGTTIEATPTVYSNGTLRISGTTYDTTIPSGSTLYAGFDTGWNTHGGAGTSVESFSGFSGAQIDSLLVTVIPEPSRAMLLLLGALVLGGHRRRS